MKYEIIVIGGCQDKEGWQKVAQQEGLAKTARITFASSPAEVRTLFKRQKWDAVFFTDHAEASAAWFIGLIREFFKGPMVAAASHYETRNRMLQAGCSFDFDPNDSVRKIPQLLRQNI